MNISKTWYITVLAVCFTVSLLSLMQIFWFPMCTCQDGGVKIFIKAVSVCAEIADSPEERQRGLSGRTHLGENEGMFFVQSVDDYYGFWMPDMHIALDIIWIHSTLEVVHIEENVLPESYPYVFKPASPARYVLEVPTGFVQKHGIELGDPISFQ